MCARNGSRPEALSHVMNGRSSPPIQNPLKARLGFVGGGNQRRRCPLDVVGRLTLATERAEIKPQLEVATSPDLASRRHVQAVTLSQRPLLG